MTVTSYIVKLIQTFISKLLVCDGKLTISLHANIVLTSKRLRLGLQSPHSPKQQIYKQERNVCV